LPDRMRTESESARELETQLLRNIIPHTEFGDDTPVNPFFPVSHLPSLRNNVNNLRKKIIAINGDLVHNG